MWMPWDESPSGEVHGGARSHEEAAAVDVEGGEAGERTRTGDDEERQVRERINNKATDTPNPHAKCAGPTRPVGTSHDLANKLSGEREGGGVAESEPEAISTPIEGRSGRMPTDRADKAKPLGDNPSGVAKVRGAEAQGGGYGGGQGSGDGMMNDASDKSQRLALKALAEDGVHQCRERLANESKDSPEPPEPPDNPTQQWTQFPSVELEEERRAALSCNVERTRTQTDASGAPGRDQDDRKRPMKLRTTSEHVNESSKWKGQKCTPGGTQVEPGDPGGKADTSAVSRCVDDASNMPKKLREASVQVCECLKRRTWQDSPSRPGEEPEEPDDEAVIPGDPHSDTECHRGKMNERIVKMNVLHRDKGPGGHMGELERSRGVEGIWNCGKVVDGAEHNGMSQ